MIHRQTERTHNNLRFVGEDKRTTNCRYWSHSQTSLSESSPLWSVEL